MKTCQTRTLIFEPKMKVIRKILNFFNISCFRLTIEYYNEHLGVDDELREFRAVAKLTAQQVADYFLFQCSPECGDTISNLKIQKLVYYAQGFYLALYDEPLFAEPIKAWQHGPVVSSLYRKYSSCGGQAIEPPKKISLSIYSKKIRALLDEIWKVYGQFSAWKLRNMAHNEPPFQNTSPNGTITRASMKEYFATLIK